VLEDGEVLIAIANSTDYSNSEIFKASVVRDDPTKHTLTFTTPQGKKETYDMYFSYVVGEDGVERKVFHFPSTNRASIYHAQVLAAIKDSDRDLFNALNNDQDIIVNKKGIAKLSPAIVISTYGYAITGHKSQGSQWDKVFVNQNYVSPKWNGARWFYTAITRAAQQVVVMPTANNTRISPEEINKRIDDIATEATTPATEDVTTSNEPKGVKVKDGIYVNQAALTKEEQLELFDYLKPFLEEQAAKTNKGVAASKMIGLGLRWDYKSNNPGKQAMDIPDVISTGNKDKYGYYDTSINNQPLAPITPRFRELMQKATGVDMTNYDGAIINLYEPNSFISSHNDVDESRSAIGYPVIGINIGGTGNFSIESRDGDPKQLDLKPGAAYVFGVNGKNRAVYHRTFAKPQDSFLPELTTKLDGKTYEPGSYRVTITMRRVMPLEEGMPSKPTIGNQNNQLVSEDEEILTSPKDTEAILLKLGAKKVSKGQLNIDGQFWYLDKDYWSTMNKGDRNELFIYPTPDQEIYVGQDSSRNYQFTTDTEFYKKYLEENKSKQTPITQDRQIQVEQFKITIKPDGKMFYDNGKELTDQTTINKVNVRKELQDGTLRTSIYNKANYFVLLDGRIVGSGKTNLGKESITDPKIKEAILAKAVTYKKQC